MGRVGNAPLPHDLAGLFDKKVPAKVDSSKSSLGQGSLCLPENVTVTGSTLLIEFSNSVSGVIAGPLQNPFNQLYTFLAEQGISLYLGIAVCRPIAGHDPLRGPVERLVEV